MKLMPFSNLTVLSVMSSTFYFCSTLNTCNSCVKESRTYTQRETFFMHCVYGLDSLTQELQALNVEQKQVDGIKDKVFKLERALSSL